MNPDIPQAEQPSSTDCLSYDDLLGYKIWPKRLSDEVRSKIEAHIPLCKQCREVSGEVQEDRRINQREIYQIPFSQLMATAKRATTQGDAITLSRIAERCLKYCTNKSVDANLVCACATLYFIAEEGSKDARNKIALFFESKRPTN